ncbi:MAG: PLP-dependent lyase/thiolase [Acidimicrobiia bacterium]|nr:PLP-dependent lyase/thiolase [Acidimicrobiia bacterium]MYC57627.1 PLP-dependent lyase/thiolase [Acidimicrobiia bacterium]MYG94427.1 PLP-dependent lyase/thiolase [Acidimicrobiia bacterium]MYI30720.1 PLP-dependent lyase/thiolase [Acidimicrobiia bacterium]
MTARLRCSCGAIANPKAWACKKRDTDEADHVLQLPIPKWWVDESSQQPFVRYRRMLWSWQQAGDDGWFVATAQRLDEAVAAIDGHGFEMSPCNEHKIASHRVTIKNETGNVSGSHKARHTFGLILHLLVRERQQTTMHGTAATNKHSKRPRLAIASCGNAAVAAAVVAAAERWPLSVFVPEEANPATVSYLKELGATVEVCPRTDDHPGDPSYARFRQATQAGAVPFGCQGPDNGYTFDGGRTLGYELAEQAPDIEQIYVQVGGGALASSVFQGLSAAQSRTRLIAVQVEGCAPLARAWRRIYNLGGLPQARAQRNAVMWPWTPTPTSAASGILDDETYDWASVSEAMAASEGYPVVVPEKLICEAWDTARSATGINVSATGSAGLAGLLHDNPPANTKTAVLFTGAQF